MEDLFEIIGSYIPDEQKDNIKSKIDGEVKELIKSKETELKKGLSKKFGINLFEDDPEKAFSDSVFVKKDKFVELETTHKKTLDEFGLLSNKVKTFEEEQTLNNLSIKLVKEGFNPDRIEVAKPLLKGIEGETDEVKVNYIKQKLPELFVGNTREDNPYKKNDEGKGLTEAERYFKRVAKTTK